MPPAHTIPDGLVYAQFAGFGCCESNAHRETDAVPWMVGCGHRGLREVCLADTEVKIITALQY